VQRVLDRAGTNWNKNFLLSADAGRQNIRQSASAGVQSDLMDAEGWGRRCMLQLQEAENWNKPAATTWAAEFLVWKGESRECLGSWINSSAVHEAKTRRAKQVITCSFPCGKWLYMIGVRKSPGCELCRRERRKDKASDEALPLETVAHDDRPFIVLTETKPSKRHIPVWARCSPLFKAPDVKRKRKASLAPTTGAGGI
jgi:hypothetical protein